MQNDHEDEDKTELVSTNDHSDVDEVVDHGVNTEEVIFGPCLLF
jgi:hypothetical protein